MAVFSLQIFVGGPTLAQGYLNRPELNASRFVERPAEVPEAAGPRLYRTGDWGYLLSSGLLEICGRCDSMVKIRGYSIEIQVGLIVVLTFNSQIKFVILLTVNHAILITLVQRI